MRAKLTLLSACVLGIATGVLAPGCQTYDFEPVEPLALAQTTIADVVTAQALKPNLMVLLDTSGSMILPVDPADPDCRLPTGTGTCGTTPSRPCPTSTCATRTSPAPVADGCCATRWTDLQAAMNVFLPASGTFARMGLTTYPGDATPGGLQCDASNTVRISPPGSDDNTSLQAAANAINTYIQSVPNSGQNQPVGGTPTGSSLLFVGNQPAMQDTARENFILLLTDGLPNCNPDNPNSGTLDPFNCQCTINRCAGDYDRRGCLDRDGSVTAISNLRQQKNIKTIVIGFGSETASGGGPATLNAMAEAGGFARNCLGNRTCGTDTCNPDTKLCNRRFYQAANQEELTDALEEIIDLVGNADPCLLRLDPAQRPSDESLIVVYVNGEALERGPDTWELTGDGIQFGGATCTRIESSTPSNPIRLEVKVVQRR